MVEPKQVPQFLTIHELKCGLGAPQAIAYMKRVQNALRATCRLSELITASRSIYEL